MSIRRRVSFGRFDAVDSAIDRLGIPYSKVPESHGYYLVSFEIEEADPRWPLVSELIQERNALELCHTVLADAEILAAEWARLVPRFEQGYPQPRAGMAWRQITYEGACSHCGTGYRQIRPFRLDREPTLGRCDVLSLLHTHTVFCTPRVLSALGAHCIQGYEVWPALLHRTNARVQSVSQLVFTRVARPGLTGQDRRPPVCPHCGTTVHVRHLRSPLRLKRQSLWLDTDIQLTDEWFSDGRHAPYREILVSNRLARLIIAERWQGVALDPVVVT